ncbi:MAG: hypothetical protein CVT59_00620 [Actinobacteria bacterium HGW-Actinobacteria-1]|jgi:hypothetical protein|nr:MAG: hypothetical protein CVT59_00620 [Actinobacteria bacterium HGW-Actinobacteria-1]
MSFFVIGRGRTDGLLRLLGQDVHETREEAVRAVQALAMAGAVSVDDVDVYIADLGTAAPVMIVGMPSPSQVEEATAGAWEAPAAAVVHDLPAADPGDVLLADALQRAASRLESEGIVPPESVGFEGEEDVSLADVEVTLEPVEPEALDAEEIETAEEEPLTSSETSIFVDDVETAVSELVIDDEAAGAAEYVGVVVEPGIIIDQEEVAEPEPAVADDLSAVIASLGSLDSEPSEEPEPVAAEVPADDSGDWPWLNVGEVAAVDVSEVPIEVPEVELEAETEPEGGFDVPAEAEPVVAPVLEPIVYDDSDTLIVTPAIEDDFTPQPVIMGDYSVTSEVVVPEAPKPEVDGDPDADAAGALADVASLPEVAEPAAVYEPAGDLTLDEYTCADCVYSNTCPKVNQTTPAECGAFQWKAV